MERWWWVSTTADAFTNSARLKNAGKQWKREASFA
jgi:hypothetical protein